MSIKKACELDLSSGRLIRFVDVGNGQEPHDADNIPLATEALVFMVVGLAVPWKMPFGYFLNAGLSGEVIKNLLLEAVHCIQECGLKVTAIVCDCVMADVAMVKLLRCRVHELTFENLRTSFPNPQDEQEEIFVMFDACHAFKLLWNLLGEAWARPLLSADDAAAAETVVDERVAVSLTFARVSAGQQHDVAQPFFPAVHRLTKRCLRHDAFCVMAMFDRSLSGTGCSDTCWLLFKLDSICSRLILRWLQYEYTNKFC
ncbi:hypothetical protein HPB49_006334 [Dermacentor silvarum]|uniref:Uncharacterized protein n=1 Tax=Dermacentor silvarum TaxID=543639 RepID=A0ACB8DW89_DERSI|nr:hypothetical protein HPB49_006334 [Dermacentor silvarum]